MSTFLLSLNLSVGHCFPVTTSILSFLYYSYFLHILIFEIENAFMRDGILEVGDSAVSKALAFQA